MNAPDTSHGRRAVLIPDMRKPSALILWQDVMRVQRSRGRCLIKHCQKIQGQLINATAFLFISTKQKVFNRTAFICQSQFRNDRQSIKDNVIKGSTNRDASSLAMGWPSNFLRHLYGRLLIIIPHSERGPSASTFSPETLA